MLKSPVTVSTYLQGTISFETFEIFVRLTEFIANLLLPAEGKYQISEKKLILKLNLKD